MHRETGPPIPPTLLETRARRACLQLRRRLNDDHRHISLFPSTLYDDRNIHNMSSSALRDDAATIRDRIVRDVGALLTAKEREGD